MKYFSVCTGIGGFELGIHQAYENHLGKKSARRTAGSGNRRRNSKKGKHNAVPICVGYSEIDPYAIKIYQQHYPTHKNYGDITKINEKKLPDFDFLFGGFPCQSFSIAGKRRGFNDTRGTIFFEICRILKAKQPRLVLLENVKGLLSHDEGRTFTTIIAALDELGYDIQWQVLNSKDFGVPQNRERVFIVGHLRGTARPKVFPLTGNTGKSFARGDVAGTLLSHYEKGAHSTGPYVRETEVGTLRTFKDGAGFRKMKSGLSPTLQARARNDGTGQPVVRTRGGGQREPIGLRIREATKQGYAIALPGDSINLSVMGSKTRRGRVGKGIAQTLDTGMQQYTIQRARGKNKGKKFKCSPTLSSNSWENNNFVGGIRRFTPIECERLQGFPDNWTAALSDTQRYKTLGNAVTVNVVQSIMERLI